MSKKTIEGVRFVMWGFPEPTQTFIHREFQEMLRQGLRVQILAGAKRTLANQPKDIRAIVEKDTIYLGHTFFWFFRGIYYGIFSGLPFFRTLIWMAKFPHRTWVHRLRAIAMTVAAAAVAPKIKASGTRHLQAHFGSYPTEWAMALARLCGITYGGTWHAVDIWKDNNILAEKVRYAEVVFTCTNYNAIYLKKVAGKFAEKVILSYHGLDFSRLPELSPLPDLLPRKIIAIGRLIPKKGFSFLLEALAILRKENFHIELSIVGDGKLKYTLKHLAKTLDIEDLVYFAGALSNQRTLELVNQSHLLIAPSIQDKDGNIDGIPNVILEAMAMGRAVIGTNLSGIPEVVNSNTGILIPPEDSTAIATALKEIFEDRKHLETLGQNAKDLVYGNFNIYRNIEVQLSKFSQLF